MLDDTVIIVSGLPRSGTSLMMQILEAGGISTISDNVRKADTDNPKGYYEMEKILDLEADSSWVAEAKGKSIKVISMLLYELPKNTKYKVIFMARNMGEILASQSKMLERSGNKEGANISDEIKTKHYNVHLNKIKPWISEQENMDVIYCDYNKMLESPDTEIDLLIEFLDSSMNKDKMLTAIDPSLYRQRQA